MGERAAVVRISSGRSGVVVTAARAGVGVAAFFFPPPRMLLTGAPPRPAEVGSAGTGVEGAGGRGLSAIVTLFFVRLAAEEITAPRGDGDGDGD